MTPNNFPEANSKFGPPKDMAESQVQTIPAFLGRVEGGSVDGSPIVVVAWKPSAEEIESLRHGGLIYLSMMGKLSPHFLTTNFKAATHPS